jgi:penicillin-binding protein 1B
LGAYGSSPLEIAGAYTVFANGGVKIDPWLLASIRSANGDVLNDYPPNSKPILDPRVAYLTLALMQNVINSGTAAVVRADGFTAPAAGKTGTSHDAWFAGFTSNLLCVVWIGNDDYTDIKLDGGKIAAPIWAEFMKHAVKLPEYSDTRQFTPPNGVSTVRLDKVTNLLADASCPSDYDAVFLDGTAPTPVNGTPALPPPQVGAQAAAAPTQPGAAPPPPDGQKKKKRGFFGRLFGGKGDDDNKQPAQPDPAQPH